MLKLEYNANVGRVMRMDDISTMGVSTYTLLEEAFQAGRTAEALALADYYHKELRIMHDILMVWAQDIMRFMILRDTGSENAMAQTLSGVICKPWRDFEFGVAPLKTLKQAVEAADASGGSAALERL